MAKKYYAVKKGLTPGVYLTWDECKKMVDGFSGAIYKSFPTLEEAMEFAGVPQQNSEKPKELKTVIPDKEDTAVEYPSNLPEGQAVAYVDGSYNVATGEYSCGVVLFYRGQEMHLAEKGTDEELASMRNVAGEILGARRAMEECIRMGIRTLTIYHDYQGIASWCLGEWKTNKEGTKAYKEYFDSIQDVCQVSFVKVKGHSADKYNDLADELAKSVIF